MIIKQFEDKPLAHYSYAIISEGKMALIDPSRDPKPYYELAEVHHAKISQYLKHTHMPILLAVIYKYTKKLVPQFIQASLLEPIILITLLMMAMKSY